MQGTTESSGLLGQNYGYFKGLGYGGNHNSVLPPQAIPKSKKKDKWEKACMDNLEREGMKQYIQNLPMTDYYKMISGEMVYVDLVDDDKDVLYDYIQKSKEELNLPSYLRHWDLMYPIVSKITGDWALQSDKFRFDTTDSVSTNDYINEKTYKLNAFTEANFKSQMNKLLLMMGEEINPDFKSEEEYNAYQQNLEQIQKEYFPDKNEFGMKKNWKTEAAQWAEKTWERDYERYRLNVLESMEARDILLTGKSVRHYRIGYDYYYPEYWHPVETFHSKESSITRIEDGEFAGRVKYYTVTELMNLYGDILNEKQRISIYKSYFGTDYTEHTDTGNSYEREVSIFGEGVFDRVSVPFEGYSDHRMSLDFEEYTGIPLSERTDLKTGKTFDDYSMPLTTNFVNFGSAIAQNLRNDIEIRTDTIQTTEAYWKGSKKLGLLSYREVSGYLTTVEVDEDILPEVKEEYKIKNLRKVSLKEFRMLPPEEKENTIVWVDVPIIYKGIKIQCSGLYNNEDIYYVEELPFQIKGEKGNIFDLKLPVCGHIGESLCKKIRPEQITYNYLLNQNQGYLEKEIGAFFVIDVNSIPMDHFDMGGGEDILINLRNLAKTTGLLPTDLSRNNLNQNGGGLMFNPMSYQNATFTDQLNRNILLAERYKWMAYEKLGLTPQAMGSPSQYSTAEGIQVGQQATFAQTYGIDQTLLENKRTNIEIHMTVAQYCQLNNKDANYIYMSSSNEIEFLQSIKDDENFSLRHIDVRPTYNARKTKEFQQLKQLLISNNTMGNDAYSLTELILSDDFLELKEASRRARMYMDSVRQEGYANEQELEKQRIGEEMQKHNDTIAVQREKNLASVKVAELGALGRTADNSNDEEGADRIERNAQLYLKGKEIENKKIAEMDKIRKDLQIASTKIDQQAQQILLDREKLKIEREKLITKRYEVDGKNRDSIINKN